MLILDCTLRDGGYYTNWDFNPKIVDYYIDNIQKLPVDYIEVGYRNPISEGAYYGEFFHLSVERIKYIKEKCSGCKVAIMLDGKKISLNNIDELLNPIVKIVDLIRVTVQPSKIEEMIPIISAIKKLGFEIAVNLMYMSKVKLNSEILNSIDSIHIDVDFLYLVDSYGGILPNEMKGKIDKLRSVSNTKIGFHGHNNMELAMANTLEAIENKIDIVDSTILGMGRGAGNLKTELLMTFLVSKKGYDIDMNIVGGIVNTFQPLLNQYKWGTNFPYMLAGSSSLAQGIVMEWLGTNRYSVNSVVRGILTTGKDEIPLTKFDSEKYSNIENIFIFGGGPSVSHYYAAITKILANTTNFLIIHSSSKYIDSFDEIDCSSLLCLSGSEVDKLKNKDPNAVQNIDEFILPPFPRKLGTSIFEPIKAKTSELRDSIFPNEFEDSPLSISLSIANKFLLKKLYLLGFDGYEGSSEFQISIREENQNIIETYLKKGKHKLVTLTKTNYRNLIPESIFSKIMLL